MEGGRRAAAIRWLGINPAAGICWLLRKRRAAAGSIRQGSGGRLRARQQGVRALPYHCQQLPAMSPTRFVLQVVQQCAGVGGDWTDFKPGSEQLRCNLQMGSTNEGDEQ